MSYKKKSKKVKRHIDSGIAHIQSTFNNTLVTVTTLDGDVLTWSSSGRLGFKGARRGTPFAASQIGTTVGKEISSMGIKRLEVNVQGPGSGRDSAIRALQATGMDISVIRDVTPLPHNGTRPPKKRRV